MRIFANYKLSNTLVKPSNSDFASTAYNHSQGSHMLKATVSSISQKASYLASLRQIQIGNDKGSTNNNNNPADAQGKQNAEVNTCCSLKGKPINHILLETTFVVVQNKYGQYIPCRALLDGTSQSHSITELFAASEVKKDPNTCFDIRHQQCKHCDTPQYVNTFKA